jgi:hypothetical protein
MPACGPKPFGGRRPALRLQREISSQQKLAMTCMLMQRAFRGELGSGVETELELQRIRSRTC